MWSAIHNLTVSCCQVAIAKIYKVKYYYNYTIIIALLTMASVIRLGKKEDYMVITYTPV